MPIYNCFGIFPGEPLKGKERYKKLYHYTSFDSFVKIWLNKNLRFSSSEKVNSILEAKKDYTAPVMSKIPLIIALQESKASSKFAMMKKQLSRPKNCSMATLYNVCLSDVKDRLHHLLKGACINKTESNFHCSPFCLYNKPIILNHSF